MQKISKRLAISLFLLSIALFQSGCAMCCSPFDYAYAGYGGLYERSDLNNGRVGSKFSDPNRAYMSDEYVEETIIDDNQYEIIE